MKIPRLKSWHGKLCLAILLLFSVMASAQQNYYLSSSEGNDNNPGTISQPFKTLDKISSISLIPGDMVLFKKGDRFDGHFVVNGSGTASQPITISSYGNGNQPILSGQVGAAGGGDYLEAIFVRNQDNLVFEDFEIQNERSVARAVDMSRLDNSNNTEAEQAVLDSAKCYGIYILNELDGSRENYTFRNLTIRNTFALKSVDPAQQQEFNAFEPAGITIATTWNYNGKVGNIDGVLIENCLFTNLQRLGVHIKQAGHTTGVGTDITNRTNNVIIRNNEFQHTGGSCILPIRTYNCLIENNMFYYPGSTVDSRMPGRGSSVWTYYCINTVIQRNNCLHIRGILDSHGIHVDHSNKNTFVQYNYMEDCEGGFVEILGGNVNAVYRYNISVNDGWRDNPDWTNSNHSIWLNDKVGSTTYYSDSSYIYNNIAYINANFTTAIDISAKNTFIFNNIFYVPSGGMGSQQVAVNNQGTPEFIKNNLFQGGVDTRFSDKDVTPVFGNPNLYNEGVSYDLGYQINAGSPAINSGMLPPSHEPALPGAGTGVFANVPAYPTEDYFGNTLNRTSGNINIGACDAKNGEVTPYTNIAVTDVKLFISEIDLIAPLGKQVNVAVVPANATNTDVTWTSLQPGIASVSNGNVTAVSEGATKIVVQTIDGNFTDTLYVTVNGSCDSVNNVNITNCPVSTLQAGGATQILNVDVTPSTVCDATVTWTSNNTAVATVNAITGEVTPLAEGTASIKATSNADSTKTDNCVITVEEIDLPAGVTPVAGEKYYITSRSIGLSLGADGGEDVITAPYGTTGVNYEWTFSDSPTAGYFFIDCIDGAPGNERIRTDGTDYTDMEPLTAEGNWVRWRLDEVTPGSNTFHMTTEYGNYVRLYMEPDGTARQSTSLITDITAQFVFHPVSTSCDSITDVTIINCPSVDLKVGESNYDMDITVLPTTNICDGSVNWSSSNTSIATVNASTGEVTPIGAGTVTISATSVANGAVFDECIITVSEETVLPPGVAPVVGETYTITNLLTEKSIGANGGDDVITSDYTISTDNYKWTLSTSSTAGRYYLKCVGGGAKPLLRSDDTTEPDMQSDNTATRARFLLTDVGSNVYLLTTLDGTYTRLYLDADGTPKMGSESTTDVSAQFVFHPASPSCAPVSSISIDNCPGSSLTEGSASYDLEATVSPGTACDTSVTWSSNNTAVATVDDSGVVIPLSAGTATITVTTTDGGFTDNCAITVDAACDVVSSVSIDNCPGSALIEGGTTYDLDATLSPGTACDTSVIWSSNNTAVATVDANGVVTPVNAGTVTITVTTIDGGYTDDCIITVDAITQNCTNKPKRPDNLSLTPTCTGVSVNWTPPAEPFCAESFIIAYKINGAAWQEVPVSDGSTTQYDLDIVTEVSEITVRMRAVNSIGVGPWTSSVIANSSDCLKTVLSTTGIDNCNNQEITLFPNPVNNGNFKIKFNSMVKKANLGIYNMKGQLVKSLELKNTQLVDIDVSELNTGSYFVKIQHNGLIDTHTVIIK